jgi:hypothetical protein
MDYLQYISIIRSGQEGSIFFINQYSELNHPPMFLQAHYSLLGFITGLFDINPFFAFTLARYIALIALTVATVMLAFRIFKPFYAVVATMFFLTSTGFYYVTGSSIFSNNDFETYSHWLNIVKKITLIPPHHYAAVILLIIFCFRGNHITNSPRSLSITFMLMLALSFLHPYVAVFLLYFLLTLTISSLLLERKKASVHVLHTFSSLLAALPGIVYNRYLLIHIWKSSTSAVGGTLAWEPPLFPMNHYLLALGPLFPLAVMSLFYPSTWKNTQTRFLIIWAFVPMMIFYLPDIGIPTGGLRLFQVYQHIPLAFLSVIAVKPFVEKFGNYIGKRLMLLLSAGLMMFAVPPFINNFIFYSSIHSPYTTMASIIKTHKPLYEFFNTKTPKHSVVMTSEMTGMTIPAFTHNKVILGHDGNNTNYKEKKSQVESFYGNIISPEKLYEFLKKYNTSYIVIDFTTPEFMYSRYEHLPFLQTVFTHDTTTVMRVFHR